MVRTFTKHQLKPVLRSEENERDIRSCMLEEIFLSIGGGKNFYDVAKEVSINYGGHFQC